ncbi:UDP-N-acetylglucosamine 2-epimerase (hydrolyzing) [Candidatus Uhrbacteria bacterium]|nr:UDP-N-acetylglucosamine 2-epimerase (hydrolyzing) [Candidatus Uhrbacteria bacterium]
MRKICFVTTHRSDFSRMEPVVRASRARADVDVTLVAAGSHLLPDSGETVNDICSLGHTIDAKAYTVVEGETLATMSKSIGLGCIEFSSIFERLNPDVVVLHGDRFDLFPAAIAAAISNIRIAHIQGGEVTGTIDESLRHCITKLSHLHFVSNEDAAMRVKKLGEDPAAVFNVGCPSVDAIKSIVFPARDEFARRFCSTYGGCVNPRDPYLILIQHPVTTEFDQASHQMEQTIHAIARAGIPTILIYPNIDAGSKQMASMLRKMSASIGFGRIDMFKHISSHDFLVLLKYASCIVGNSSSGIREAGYFGTPCVNIGSRQSGRLRGANVKDVTHDVDQIAQAILEQVQHAAYPVEELYGHGHTAQTMVEILAQHPLPPIQKSITF